MPCQASFVEEHLKEARKCNASLDYHWLAYKSRGTQPAMNAEQSNTTEAVNDSESNNNYTSNNPVAQTVPNWATASGQETENDSETSSAKKRREENMKKFNVEFKTKISLEQARFKRRRREHPSTGPRRREMSQTWASRIDNHLKLERSTARFEVTPEVNRYSQFSRYRSSRERSSSVEDRDVSPERVYCDTTVGMQLVVTYQSWS